MDLRPRLQLALATLALTLAGCSGPCQRITALTAPVTALGGRADFTTYVALGTSISAGFQSGGLVARHQRLAFPALFAQQVRRTGWTLPTVGDPGLPPLLRLESLQPLVVARPAVAPGVATNAALPVAYDDMAVYGCLLVDVADSSLYYVPDPSTLRPLMFPLVAHHRGTLLQQVASLHPTFVSFELGANEVLAPALQGSGTALVGVAAFGALLSGTLAGLEAAAPGVRIALFNVPDVTSIPFVTTFPPVVLGPDGHPLLQNGAPVPLLGTSGPLGLGDHVLLTAGDSLAAGTGFPPGTFSYLSGAPGNGRPLRDDLVLTAAEGASLQAAVDGYNAAIATAAADTGVALVDLNGLLRQAATTGFTVEGMHYSSAFIEGGLFSLDGVHPGDLAHALLANAMIDAVNARFGCAVPHADVRASMTLSSSRVAPAGAGRLPWVRDAEAVYRRMVPWRGPPPR